MGETIVISSAKGGEGKTVIATNMAVILAKWGYRTLLIDTDIGYRNSDIRLGMENEVVYDLADIIKGVCRIKQGIIKDKRLENLYFIPSPYTKEKADISESSFKSLLEELKPVFDYILIDAPSVKNRELAYSPEGVNKILFVLIPEFGTVRDIESIKHLMQKKGESSIYLLINKDFPDLTQEGITPSQEEISDLLGLPVLGAIPFSKEIHKWANRGFPMAGLDDLTGEELSLVKGFEALVHKLISKVDNLAPDANI